MKSTIIKWYAIGWVIGIILSIPLVPHAWEFGKWLAELEYSSEK